MMVAKPKKVIVGKEKATGITKKHVKVAGLGALAIALVSSAIAIFKGTVVCTGPIKSLSCVLAAIL